MDQNLPPTAPSTTVPSEQGEHISNLSTRPNLFEQNDSHEARGINHSHHSQSIHLGRENNHVQQHSEKQQSNNSRNFNKAHSEPIIENSDYPNLNQNVSQLLPSQDSKDNKIKTQRKLQLTTFDENWESDLKQEQADRQEYHELFHENNELLLTQKLGDEFSSTPEVGLQSELLVDEDRRSDVSNQVKINQIITHAPEIIYEESSHRSDSIKDQPINPLFENTVKDDSQSNLLDFGFSRQSRKPYHTWTSRAEPIILQPPQSQNSNSIQVVNNNDSSVSSLNQVNNRVISIQNFSTISQIGYKQPEQPMIIEETAQNSQQKNSRRSSKHHSHHGSQQHHSHHSPNHSQKHSNQFIKIEVHNCKEEVIDSYSKNNDIYGIAPKHQVTFAVKQSIGQTQSEYFQQNTGQEETSPPKQPQRKLQIEFKEEQKQNYPQSQTFILNRQQQVKYQQRQQPQETVEGIMEKLNNILNSSASQSEKAHDGARLLQNHINFLFLTPMTEIGKEILLDGNNCVVLIDIILMKEDNNVTKDLLRKYLQLTFASKIRKGQNKLIQYQQSLTSISISQPVVQQKPKQNEIYANQTTYDTLNESVYAEHGSVGKNSNEKMIIDNENEPIKRTLVTRQPVALKSQKQTRKTRLKTKGKNKGKTTAKKSLVKFETDSNQSPVKQQVQGSQIERKEQISSFSKKRESQKIMNDSFHNVDTKQYGSKFTFILRDNLRSDKKQLVQLRKSQRIAKKQSNSQVKQKGSSRTRRSQKSPNFSPKKPQRLSSSKIFLEQQININYIKAHMKDLTVKNVTMLQQFKALTPLDEDIMNIINDYNEAISSQRRTDWRESQEQVQDQPAQDIGLDSTTSIVNSNNMANTNAESISISRKQFRQKLSKYKIPNIVIITKVIDPNINDHGIYALLQLDRISQILYGAKFALTPITNLSRASKRLIDQDLEKAKHIVRDVFDNFAFIQPTETILKEIEKEKQLRLKKR